MFIATIVLGLLIALAISFLPYMIAAGLVVAYIWVNNKKEGEA